MHAAISPVVAHANLDPAIVGVLDSRPFQTDGEIGALAFAEDGTLWSVEEPGILRQWDPHEGQQLAWSSLTERATLWLFGPTGRLLASAGDGLVLWDLASGRFLATLPQHSWVTALAFLWDRSLLAVGYDDGT